MPAPTIVAGAPCWNDLYSSDTDKARAFYGGLFGWTTMDPGPEYGGYFLFQKDGKVVAGCMGNDGEQGVPDMWTIYLSTDDADRTAEAAKAHGGQVHLEPMDVTQNGRFAMLADPGGAVDRRLAAARRQRVRDPRRGRRARLVRAPDARLRRRASTSTATSSAGTRTPRATRTNSATRRSAKARPPSPGSWTRASSSPRAHPPPGRSTSRVDDVDATLERAVELGGSIEHPAEDTPYGRLATVGDPTGTRFRLMGPNVG